MNHQIMKTLALLFIISYVLFPQRIFSQETQIEKDLYVLKDEISGKYGVVDINNEIIIPFEYDDIYDRWDNGVIKDKNSIIVEKNGKLGCINIYNEEMIPCFYESLCKVGYGLYRHICQDKYGLIDSLGNTILPCEYNSFDKEGKFLFVHNDKNSRIFDLENREFVIPRNNLFNGFYDDAYGSEDPYKNVFMQFIDNNHKVSIVRTKDLKPITKYKYDVIEWGEVEYYGNYFSGGLALVKRNGKFGAINEEGKEVVPVEFDWMSLDLYLPHNKAIAVAAKKTSNGLKYTCYNVNGEQLVEFSPHRIYAMKGSDGGFLYKKENDVGYHFYNCKGEIKSKNILSSDVHNILDIGITVKKGDCFGFVSNDGTELIPCKYRGIERVGDNCISLTDFKGRSYIYNVKKRKFCSSLSFDSYRAINNNIENEGVVLFVESDGAWGVLDLEKCRMIFPCIYDEASFVGDNLIYVKKNNRYGFANLDGDITNIQYPSKDNAVFYMAKFKHEKARSDVDTNIPINFCKSEQTFAVIIANEKYTEASIQDVPYASNDGSVFREYCQKTLGIPNANIKYRENATLNQIRYDLNWLKDVIEVYNGDAKIIFYYAGHGIPDVRNSSAYLLPSDGFGSDINSAYSLDELYSQLGELPAKQITVFMDACFSGAKRDGDMLTSARSVAIKAKSGTPKGKMVVFSAAQGDETAHQYNKKKHGMFTYFLLKKLQETKGKTTLDELATYIKKQVQKCSIMENGARQSPTIQLSPDFNTSIKEISL